jgi:3-oxoacyl-[acyl-carrier-protein] synthase-3
MKARPAVVGTGSCLPDRIRYNDDPIFDWLRENEPDGSALFAGYYERRVLEPGQELVDIMVPAARAALEAAGRTAAEVDLLLGYASTGDWAMPNELALTALRLGLPPHASVIALNNEFANFNAGLLLGDAMLAAGRARCALVVVGTNWTRRVDYHTPPAISVGDGAGAAVMAMSTDRRAWSVIGHGASHDYRYFGGMYLAADRLEQIVDPPVYLAPTFHLLPLGIEAYQDFGITGPPRLAREVLGSAGLVPGQVAFVGHQASSVLNDAWRKELAPGLFATTLELLGNMTSASIPVNLDRCRREIDQDYVLLAALGPEVSADVVLLAGSAEHR